MEGFEVGNYLPPLNLPLTFDLLPLTLGRASLTPGPACRLIEQMHLDDAAAVALAAGGDEDAFRVLVERHSRSVFRLAFRMTGSVQDAEDVTQSVFCNVFQSLASYDPRYRFFSWIYRMTMNESLNLLKRRRPMVTLNEDAPILGREPAADDALEAEDRVGRALMELNANDRSLVVLRHFHSLSYTEIAEVLKVAVPTVKSRLFTARERLRLVLLGQRV